MLVLLSSTFALSLDAEVFFNGVPTTQTGGARLFLTPPLEAGRKYRYDVVARWTQAGKRVRSQRRIAVAAGARVDVDLLAGADAP